MNLLAFFDKQTLIHSACVIALCCLFSACQQDDPAFQEGEETVTGNDGGNNNGGGGSNGDGDGGTTIVGGAGKARAFLSWDIPEYRENGEELELSDIAGYEIVFRQLNQESYTVITLQDSNSDSHTINNLDAGNYEFMIAVFDEDGLFSDYSEPVVASLVAN